MDGIKKMFNSLKQLFPHTRLKKYNLSENIVYVVMWKEWLGKKYEFCDCITARKLLVNTSAEEINEAIKLFIKERGNHCNV